jgi:tetratricopeptide (TPR) repeat protein
MVIEILEAEGTPHTGVEIAADAPPPTQEAFLRGIRAVAGRFPDREVCMYFDLRISGGAFFEALGAVVHCDELKSAFDRLLKLHPKVAQEAAVSSGMSPSKAPPAKANDGATGHALPLIPAENPATAGSVPTSAVSEIGFSILDRLIIRTLVATAADAENALSRVEAEALVEEALALSPERHRSWFHGGFMAALFGIPLSFTEICTNADRRSWKLVGFLLGRARSERPNLAGILKEHAMNWRELLEPSAGESRREARRALLPLVPHLILGGLWLPLSELLRSAPAPVQPADMQKLYTQILEAAYGLIDAGRHEEAIPLLSALRQMGAARANAEEEWNQLALAEVLRRLGQAHMQAGRFAAAIPILEQIVRAFTDSGRFLNAVADLWLARASIRSMAHFLPTDNAKLDRDRVSTLSDQDLLAGLKAAQEAGSNTAHLQLALGFLRFHQRRWSDAENHLAHALGGMMLISGEYQASGLIDHVRCLLGLAIAERGEPGRVHEALGHLTAAMGSNAAFPVRVLEDWTRALALLEQVEPAADLADRVVTRDAARGWRLIVETELTRANQKLRVRYTDWIRKRPQQPASSMRSFAHLLDQALGDGAISEAEQLLDDMESLARHSTTCAEAFLETLTQRRNQVAAAWDEDSIDLSLAATFESLDRMSESADVLRRAFFRARHYASPEIAEALLGSLEQIQVFEPREIERLRALLGQEANEVPFAPLNTLQGAVLFVGGNETQARYRHDIVAQLRAQAPALKVEFRFPGWGSNWIFELEDCRRILPKFDVVVIHRYVRTQFGRALRAACGPTTPWRACTGSGRQSMLTAIENAAAWRLGRAV